MAFITTAQVIINDAARLAQDVSSADGITPAYTRWKVEEYLAGVNDGCKAICFFKPDAYVVSASVTLAAGIVQEIPTAGTGLYDITCNMGVSPGTTQGNAIQLIDRKVLDAMDPGWPAVTASATVIYYMYDERYPRQFLVYPKQPSTGFGFVQMIYPAAPAEIAIGATILISDIYRPALLQYEMYFLYSKDLDNPASAGKAEAYYRAFLNCLGVKQDVEVREDPNKQ